MRILFLDQFSELGGAQLCLLDLLPEFVRRGWEPHVALPGDGPMVTRVEKLGVPTRTLALRGYSQGNKNIADAAKFLMNFPPLALQIRRLLREIGPQLVYVNGPRLLPAVALSRVHVPVVFHSHNWIGGAPSRLLARVALKAVRANVIAASRFVAGQWPGAEVAHTGVEGPGQGMRERVPNGSPRIGMIGRIGPQKRQLEFARAAGGVDAEFVLCGDASFGGRSEREYKRKVLEAAPANLTWLGWCDSVYEVLSTLDLLVVPSSLEGGVPRVILEAFSCGVPVLACATGATAEAIQPDVTGFTLSSAHPDEITRRIRELLAAPERLAAVAARGRLLWRERFTVERFRGEIVRLLESFVGAGVGLQSGRTPPARIVATDPSSRRTRRKPEESSPAVTPRITSLPWSTRTRFPQA